MTGIVLTGTYPWNGSAFDRFVPRPLLPVAHRPLIWYTAAWLHGGGIRDIAVCGNRETRALEATIVKHVPAGVSVTYHQDPSPRGTAGSIRDAAVGRTSDIFVVAEGTAIPNLDLPHLLASHRASGAAVTVVVHNERRLDGKTGQAVSTGIYVFSRRALDHIPPNGFCDIKERLIPELYRVGEHVVAHCVTEASARVLDADTYLAVNGWMVGRVASTDAAHQDYVRIGEALVHRGASVAADAVLVGPVLVECGAQIGSQAVVVGPCSIGRDARIDPHVAITRSAIWRRSQVQESAVVDRSIICDDAVVVGGRRMSGAVVVPAQRRSTRPAVAGAESWRRSGVESWRRALRALVDPAVRRAPAAQ